jgi:hypothetical protein
MIALSHFATAANKPYKILFVFFLPLPKHQLLAS